MPVGHGTLGRIINVIGEPVDEQGPIGEQREPGAAMIIYDLIAAYPDSACLPVCRG